MRHYNPNCCDCYNSVIGEDDVDKNARDIKYVGNKVIEAHNLYLEKLTRGLPCSSFSLSLLFSYLLLFLLLRPLKTPAHGSVKLC